MSLVQAHGISFSYGQHEIIHSLSFAVNPGEIFCLFGPNGCGKTTLLECLLGLLKISDGKILLGGINPQQSPPAVIARVAAYVPQVHQKTFPYLVREIVMMGRAAYTGIFSSPGRKELEGVDEVLATVGILHLRDKPYVQLSGGEMQLVMIARALLQKTPVMILDEPTAHLDYRNDLLILETVARLVTEQKLTVLMSTHNPNQTFYFESKGIATRVALMHSHTFVATGPPSQVLTEENLRRYFRIETKIIPYCAENRLPLHQVFPLGINNTETTEEKNAYR
ncbi:MAG TPA: ABC transporter ATP-binding protein [Firmicutes bacterium]|nr:ABC transporter ATP-binding protein [Bacillota bacterium]